MVEVTVTALKDYGAFVELPSGNSTLLHISELSWERVSCLLRWSAGCTMSEAPTCTAACPLDLSQLYMCLHQCSLTGLALRYASCLVAACPVPMDAHNCSAPCSRMRFAWIG